MTQIFESCPVYAIRPHCSAHMVSLLNKKISSAQDVLFLLNKL